MMKLEFNEQQLQVLNAAIIELPYRVSAPLIDHINQQIKEQLNCMESSNDVRNLEEK